MARVRLVNISKHYGPTVAVEHVNLDVAEGEFVTLLGPSGCGKSTTMNMISGLEMPSSGSIYFDERRVNEVPAGQEEFKKLNADLAKKWPVITEKKAAPPDAKQWEGVVEKKNLLET